MLTFLLTFLRRGFIAMFSYLSFQVPATRFWRLMKIVLCIMLTYMSMSLLL